MSDQVKSKRGRKPVNPDQPAVIQAWRDLGAAYRGHTPTVDARTYRAANLLLKDFTVEQIREMIAHALTDPWFVAHGTLATIRSQPDKYRPRVNTNAVTVASDVPYHAEYKPSW